MLISTPPMIQNHPTVNHNLAVAARLLVVYLLLQYITESQCQDSCPCIHCGPPMCQPLCKVNCAKCCTCCVYFGARIGKRSNHFSRWETQGLLDINKREPHKEVSLRLSILQKSEERLFDNKHGLVLDRGDVGGGGGRDGGGGVVAEWRYSGGSTRGGGGGGGDVMGPEVMDTSRIK